MTITGWLLIIVGGVVSPAAPELGLGWIICGGLFVAADHLKGDRKP